MIRVSYSPMALELVRCLRLSRAEVLSTMNDRHHALVSDGLDRIISAHWFTDDHLVFLDAIVTKRSTSDDGKQVRFDEVAAHLVLSLSPQLPAGTLSRKMSLEQMLGVVARSFGHPVTGHPDVPSKALYAGRWDGNTISVKQSGKSGLVFVAGSFYPDRNTCELVYAFNADAYWDWYKSSPLCGPSVSREAAKLSASDLADIAKDVRKSFPEVKATKEALQFSMAVVVLRTFLPETWCDRHIPGGPDAHPRLRQEGENHLSRMKAQSWLVAFGEMIFNLQDVPGFDGRLERVVQADLESAVAELEAARLLAMSNVQFRFVRESGNWQEDYDIELDLPSGDPAACETKSKRESTPLSYNSVLNSLRSAARQVPEVQPAVVFLRLPESWLEDSELKRAAETAAASFLRNNGRVVSLVYFWEEWHQLDTGSLLRLAKFREFGNSDSRYYDSINVDLIRSWESAKAPSGWVTFAKIADSLT